MAGDKVSMEVCLQDTSKREVSCLEVLRGAGGKRVEERREERRKETVKERRERREGRGKGRDKERGEKGGEGVWGRREERGGKEGEEREGKEGEEREGKEWGGEEGRGEREREGRRGERGGEGGRGERGGGGRGEGGGGREGKDGNFSHNNLTSIKCRTVLQFACVFLQVPPSLFSPSPLPTLHSPPKRTLHLSVGQ